MIILKTNETYFNSSNLEVFYKVVYVNYLGHKQEQKDVLKPLQSITKTNSNNKVIILA